jgi:hypothetical protein
MNNDLDFENIDFENIDFENFDIYKYLSQPKIESNVYKRFIDIEEEKKNGRKLNTNIDKKVYNYKVFNTISDEELFCEENKDNLKKYLEQINMCCDENCLSQKCKNIIIVYTNKKVGSTSLWGSFNLYLSSIYKTSHIHSSFELERFKLYDITMCQFFKILKLFNKNVFIIDIYRPIFDICVSNYFNELHGHFQRDFEKYPELENKNTVVNRFFKLFNDFYDVHNVDYYKEIYNIPNIPSTFDFDNKHLVYKDENLTYIKLRLCDSDNWNNILSKYIGYKFKNIKFNESEKKPWGQLYKYFKNNFTITTEIYELLKNNVYFKYYYTPEEQNKYLQKFTVNDNTIIPYNENEIKFYKILMRENEVSNLYGNSAMFTNHPIANNCPSKKNIHSNQEKILNNEIYNLEINENDNILLNKITIIDDLIEMISKCNPNIRTKQFLSINGEERLFIDNITQDDLDNFHFFIDSNINNNFIDDFSVYSKNEISNKFLNIHGLSETISQLFIYSNNKASINNIHYPFLNTFKNPDTGNDMSISEYIDIQINFLNLEPIDNKLFRIIINPNKEIEYKMCILNEDEIEISY